MSIPAKAFSDPVEKPKGIALRLPKLPSKTVAHVRIVKKSK